MNIINCLKRKTFSDYVVYIIHTTTSFTELAIDILNGTFEAERLTIRTYFPSFSTSSILMSVRAAPLQIETFHCTSLIIKWQKNLYFTAFTIYTHVITTYAHMQKMHLTRNARNPQIYTAHLPHQEEQIIYSRVRCHYLAILRTPCPSKNFFLRLHLSSVSCCV